MKNQTPMIIAFALFGLLRPFKAAAQDWANLAKYQEANAALPAPKPNEKRIVFMGNSITEGWAQASPKFFIKNPYINRGIGGQTTPQMLLRFRQDVVALDPKMVVILAGTNDIAENTGPVTLDQIRDQIHNMVQLAKANNIVPIVCSVLPAYDYPWRPGLRPNVKIPQLNALLKTMADAEQVPYLDYFSEMADTRNGLPPKYTTDEVHLTKKGYKVMEKMVKKKLLEVGH